MENYKPFVSNWKIARFNDPLLRVYNLQVLNSELEWKDLKAWIQISLSSQQNLKKHNTFILNWEIATFNDILHRVHNMQVVNLRQKNQTPDSGLAQFKTKYKVTKHFDFNRRNSKFWLHPTKYLHIESCELGLKK